MPNKLKKLRINSKKQIERLFKQPFLLEYPFKVHYLIEDGRGEMHCLIAVSHKQYKKAVDFILSQFSWNEQQYKYVLNLLLNTFYTPQYESVFLYIYF